MKAIRNIIIDAKIETLETLLDEIAEHQYTRPEHVVSHIRTGLDILNDIKIKDKEYENE